MAGLFSATFQTKLTALMQQAVGSAFILKSVKPVSGGSICDSFVISDNLQAFFIKLTEARNHPMLCAEAAGLAALKHTQAVRVPEVITSGLVHNKSCLVLEWLPLKTGSDRSAKRLGEQLGALHQQAVQPAFGWDQDTYLGTSLQPNTWQHNWIDFFSQQRLGHQLQQAKTQLGDSELNELGEHLVSNIAQFFSGYTPKPALIHGDLWAGNWAMTDSDQPCIFDPAIYQADREAELAMTHLFGGFPASFYQAYQANWPLDEGYQQRQHLYLLYHLLNHANLFGQGYLIQAKQTLRHLINLLN